MLADELSAYPKAVKKITGELDLLLTFFDFPAPHWKHLRTTNPIESPFSTVRLRTRVTKGAGCRDAAVAMAFKLLESAQERWRRVDGYELVALVRAGATFIDGKLVERPHPREENTDENDQKHAASRLPRPQHLTITRCGPVADPLRTQAARRSQPR